MIIAPSLLAADFSCLGGELERIHEAGMVHIDIMDGCFVPNLSMGPLVVSALRGKTKQIFDVHLMLEHPLNYIEAFRSAGADLITFHIECADDPAELIAAIRKSGAKPGIAIKPGTQVEKLLPFCKDLYLVTIMTVEPGFGGQKLMPQPLEKIARIKAEFPHILAEVDGGVNDETAGLCKRAGADILVAGTAIFRAEQPGLAMKRLQEAE